MIEETGVVTKIDGMTAKVIVQKRGTCDGCAAKGVCETTTEGMEIDALNPVNAQVGQTVKVAINPRTYLKGTMVVYGIPLVALIGGAIAGKNIADRFMPGTSSDLVAVIAGFGALVVSFVLIKVFSRGSEEKAENKPVIEEIIG